VNFYNEINSPQHREMFKFFDKAFIGKSVQPESEFVVPMSNLPSFVNDNL
jgi:type II restriction enzyme